MSEENAKKLIERMKMDEAFAKEVLAITDLEGRLAHIRNVGYDCTAEEIQTEAQRYHAIAEGAEGAEGVAGGKCKKLGNTLCTWTAGFGSGYDPCPDYHPYGVKGHC